jgi:DNA-binding transcriptional MerR regulator
MPKSRQKLFYKIGEVCKICEIEPHVLRYWETVFARLKPVKNRAGQRIYRRTDLELVERIKNLLYEQGFTISGANSKLLEEGLGGKEQMPLFQGSLQSSQKRALKEIKHELDAILEILDGSKAERNES